MPNLRLAKYIYYSPGDVLKSISEYYRGAFPSASHTENPWEGDPITCWSTGCLCDLHPAYMPNNKWQLGFAYSEITGEDGRS